MFNGIKNDAPGRVLNWVIRVFSTILCLLVALPGLTAESGTDDPSNPIIATYDGGTVHLRELEDFAREMPLAMRIPFVQRSGSWRAQMAGELAKSIELTSHAIELGYHLDPAYLRGRGYFENEYLAFCVLRDHISNRMDVSLDSQKKLYETIKSDFWLSPTVTLRLIRTSSEAKITSAAAAIQAGTPFEKAELQFSEVSPRYRGRVIGPFPGQEDRTAIPPPDQVIQAANAVPDNTTTGPLQVGGFFYLVHPVTHTPGRQQTLDDVAEKVEERLRDQQYAQLVPALVNRIQQDLGVEVDEKLFATGTRPDDQLATIGATRLYRQEFTDLNGTVRGPATPIAQMMPTRLKSFILPYMIGEWARLNHYKDRKETKNALYYYDIQHLASRVSFELAEKLVPPPDEAELRRIFQANIDQYRVPGQPEPRFEDVRKQILDARDQDQAQEREARVSQAVQSKIHFKPVPAPVSANITAMEALVAAADRLPADARLLEIGPARVPTEADGGTAYSDIGRAPSWRITYASASGATELVVNGPTPLLESQDQFSSIPAYTRWANIWRFDTDALKRHIIDKSLGDFITKHNGRVRAAATVEFSYSKDDPTSPTDCMIVYSATPVDGPQDGILIRYNAYDGEITKRRLGEPEGKCPTCPAPDLPAPSLLNTLPAEKTTTPTLDSPGTGEMQK